MNDYMWAVIRKRASLALPLVQALIVYYGITSDHAAALWISLVSVLITGVALSSDPRTDSLNVSRETSRDLTTAMGTGSVSRETSEREHWTLEAAPAPCAVMHGSAEPHVLGCEGWSLPSE